MMSFRTHIARAALLLALAAGSSCTGSELDSKMLELRQTIALSDTYVDAFHRRVGVLKEKLESAQNDSLKAELGYRLFTEYYPFNTDSAKTYVSSMLELGEVGFPKDVLRAWRYSIDGDWRQFKLLFDDFDPAPVPDTYRSDCYAILASSYLLLKDAPGNDLCIFMSKASQDPAAATDVKEMFIGTLYRHEGEQLYAREHFMKAYEASGSTHMQSKTAYLVAHTYKATGNIDKYEYWLAQSAIHDLNVPVKNYSSIQDLAMAELSRKHFKEAADMVDLFVKDALDSKYWVRVNTAIEYEKAIITEVNKAERRSILGLSVSTALMLLLIGVMLLLLRKNYKLNKALALSDKEKEEYIHKYMKLSLNYLGSVEKYRHKLRLLLKSEGKDAVLAQLRGPSESEAQYTDFYKEFDDTFLKIYPSFVTKVNSLLKPEARFEDEHSLNLPLRVLAAIKLGITESRDIATFLNCAPASVYTYRSKLKANSVIDKDIFETEVCKIS